MDICRVLCHIVGVFLMPMVKFCSKPVQLYYYGPCCRNIGGLVHDEIALLVLLASMGDDCSLIIESHCREVPRPVRTGSGNCILRREKRRFEEQ